MPAQASRASRSASAPSPASGGVSFSILLHLRFVLPGQQGLPVLVELDLGDHDLGGVDADLHCLPVGLLACHALDEDPELLAVAAHDFAFAVMVAAPEDHDLVVLADGDGPDVVLRLELLAQGAAHDLAADVRRRREVLLARSAAGGADACLLLHGWPLYVP